MNFKMTVQLFVLIFCALGAKSTLAMNKLAKAINQLEVQQKAKTHDQKKKDMWLGFFDKAFKAKDLNTCVKYLKSIKEIYGGDEKLAFSGFYKEYDKIDATFMSEIIRAPRVALEAKIQEAYKARNAAECVKLLKQKIELLGQMDRATLFKRIKDREFISQCEKLLNEDADITRTNDQPSETQKAKEEEIGVKKSNLDQSRTEAGKKIDDVIDKSKEELLNKFEEAFKRKDAQACHEYFFVIYYNFERDEVDDFCKKYTQKNADFFSHIIDLGNRIAPKIPKIDEEQKVNVDESLKEKRLQRYKKLSAEDLNKRLRKVAQSGNWDKVDALLCAGANKNYIDEQGFAMVHIAGFFGHTKVLEILHKHGADLTVKTRDECWNILHLVHDSFETYHIYQKPAVEVVIFVLTHCKQLMTEKDKKGISPVCLFMQNNNLIGAVLKYNEIIDNNGAVLI